MDEEQQGPNFVYTTFNDACDVTDGFQKILPSLQDSWIKVKAAAQEMDNPHLVDHASAQLKWYIRIEAVLSTMTNAYHKTKRTIKTPSSDGA